MCPVAGGLQECCGAFGLPLVTPGLHYVHQLVAYTAVPLVGGVLNEASEVFVRRA